MLQDPLRCHRRAAITDHLEACLNCLPHDLLGDAAHRAAALEDHANRSLELAERAYDQLRRRMQERDEALEERKRFGQMLYQANDDRDYLRRHLDAAWSLHAETLEGHCSCGERPCSTPTEANRVAGQFDRYQSRWLRVPRPL
jgi:hypothetical protein